MLRDCVPSIALPGIIITCRSAGYKILCVRPPYLQTNQFYLKQITIQITRIPWCESMVNLPVGRTLYYTGFSIQPVLLQKCLQLCTHEYILILEVLICRFFSKKVFYCSCVYTHMCVHTHSTSTAREHQASASMCVQLYTHRRVTQPYQIYIQYRVNQYPYYSCIHSR